MNEKVNAKDLKPSERSPVIPVIPETEKAKVAQELNDKAKKKAERRAARLAKEKAKAEKAKKGHERKPKKEPEHDKPAFPAESKVNKYGFIYMSGDMLAAFGLHKGAEHKLSINLEGDALTIRKA